MSGAGVQAGVLRSVLVAACLATAAGGSAAWAGPLSKVVHGMKKKSGQDDDGDKRTVRSGRSGDGDDGSSADESYDDGDWGYAGSGSSWGCCAAVVAPAPRYGGETDILMRFGVHRVDESNGALIGSIRASHGDFGMSLADTMYAEQAGPDTIELHIWTVGGVWRLLAPTMDQPMAVWVTGGLAGASSDGLQLYGLALGVEVERHLGGSLGVEGSARALHYQDDIRGLELRAAIAASLLRLGYRHTKFNTGPALKGPEVGIALAF